VSEKAEADRDPDADEAEGREGAEGSAASEASESVPSVTKSAREGRADPKPERKRKAAASKPGGSGPWAHLLLLVMAAAFAVFVWTRDKKPKIVSGDVTVWPGRPSDVQQIVYDSKKRKVVLEAKSDGAGRYFVGTVDRETPPPKKPAGDAGAPPPEEAAKRTSTQLLSVGAAGKMVELLAPLKALRALGKIGDDRASEFGLADADATVTVRIGGSERKLLIGGATPGGADKYVKETSTGEVFAVKGDAFRDLESAESRLVERDLHEWKDAEVKTATISAGGKTRDMVRGGTDAKKFWADRAQPDVNDETLGNWMSKLDRLRPTEYVATAPEGKEVVLKVEYAAGRPLGFIELVKVPGGAGGKPDYFVTTERTRLFAKVAANLGEQVEQDLGGVVK
jgi:hypothetical protein